MKNILFLSLVLIISCQPATLQEKKTTNIVNLKGMSKQEIYSKTLEWIATTFQESKAVIDFKDPVKGRIFCNIVTTYITGLSTAYVKSKMIIDVKKGKARFRFISHEIRIEKTIRAVYNTDLQDIKKTLLSLVLRYKTFMLDKKYNTDNDNW